MDDIDRELKNIVNDAISKLQESTRVVEACANVHQLTPSRSSLWLNWRIARYGVTEQAREHGHAMIAWIFQYHRDETVRQTAYGMLKVLQRRGTWNQSGPMN